MQVLVTTSRDPSSKLTSFAKEVALVIPGAKSQNRGATVIAELVDSCRASDVTDMIVVHETRCVNNHVVLWPELTTPCVVLMPHELHWTNHMQRKT